MTRKSEQPASADATVLMSHAESVCRAQSVAFTPIRRQVFALLCRHQRPAGAYELLHELRALRPNAAPVTVYRALEFLQSTGLAHKVHALNAFTVCRGSDPPHSGLMLICSKCSSVTELTDRSLESTIARSAAEAAFAAGDEPVEVLGTCADCQP